MPCTIHIRPFEAEPLLTWRLLMFPLLLFLFLLPGHLAMAVAPAISNPTAQAPATQAHIAALQ